MSTIKADAVTAVSTNGDLSLDGLGTGGVSIASTLKMTKGGDISSASPLVIDTDGNYFDVTGTTNFSAMTVESGNFFMLQFDGALTITHGSGIELPGAANLTTATGDRLICYATAANTVEVMSVETEAASAGGITIGTEQATTSGTDISFTSIPSGTKRITINFAGVSLSGTADYLIEIGDSGGYETSGYTSAMRQSTTSTLSTAGFLLCDNTNANGLWHGSIVLSLERASTFRWCSFGSIQDALGNGAALSSGSKALSAELDRLQITSTGSDTFDAGVMNITYE